MIFDVLLVLLTLALGYWLGYTAPRDSEKHPFD